MTDSHPDSSPTNADLPRRTVLGAFAGISCGAALVTSGATAVAAGPASGGSIELVGSPLQARNIRTAAIGALPDGTPVAYLPTFGEPAKLNVVNAETGALIGAHELTGKTTAYYSGIAPDGTAYVAGQTPGANLFRYDPDTRTLRDLGAPIPGETNIARLTTYGPDSTLYTGTFPNGHVISYDPDTDAFADLGEIAEGEQYARSTATDGTTLWVGTGTHARLFSIDLASGAKAEITLPEPYAGAQTFVNDMHHRDGLVFAFLSPAYAWVIYDTATGQWRESLTEISATNITESVDGHVYYVAKDNNLHSYQTATGATATVLDNGQISSSRDQGIGLVQLSDPDWPGTTVAGATLDGQLWHLNLTTKQFRRFDTEAEGGALKIAALGFSPDEQLYATGYLTPGVAARIDPRTLAVTSMRSMQQAEFIGSVPVTGQPTRLYVGSYIDAGVWQLDHRAAWDYPRNPHRVARLSRFDQERVLTITGADDRLAVGTLGVKGNPSGRLSVVDPLASRVEWSGEPVPGQSVSSLLFRRVTSGPILVGGTTSVQLGVDERPDAHLFVFDLTTQQTFAARVPVPGAHSINQILELPDGRVWALASDSSIVRIGVHRTDSATEPYRVEVTPELSLFVEPTEAGSWASPQLAVLDDSTLAGSAAGKVFTLDIASKQVTIIADGTDATPGPDRTIFFANLTKVFRYVPDDRR